ncbi:unnamed protein product, partial [Eretmochelys imbricata]
PSQTPTSTIRLPAIQCVEEFGNGGVSRQLDRCAWRRLTDWIDVHGSVTAVPREEEPAPQPSLGELSASNVTHDSALLSWTVQSGDFDSFLLQYKDAEGKPQALPVDGGSRTVTVANLAPSRRYKFNLYGISGRKRLGPVSTDAVT